MNLPVQITHTTGGDPPIKNGSDDLHHQIMVSNALQTHEFKWVVNRFGSGAFYSVCKEFNIPFSTPIACDTSIEGRSMLQDYGRASHVLSGSQELLEFLRRSDTSYHGYFNTSPWSLTIQEEAEYLKNSNPISFIHYKFGVNLYYLSCY